MCLSPKEVSLNVVIYIRFKYTPNGGGDHGIFPVDQVRVEEIFAVYTPGTLKNGKGNDQKPKKKMGKEMNRQFTEKRSNGP